MMSKNKSGESNEETFRNLFETMSQGVIYQDADGTIIIANPAAQRILGLTMNQMREKTPANPLWKAIREDGSDLPSDQHPTMVALRTGLPVTDEVIGLHNPADGLQRWIMVDAMPQFREGSTTPYQVYATFTDITAHKQSVDALRESENRFRGYFENKVAGTAITSPSKGWIEVNHKLCQMLGYSRKELSKLTWAEMTHPDDLAADVKQFNRLVAGEIDVYALYKRFIRKDGTVIPVILNVAGVREADRSLKYIIAILLDITERKQAEEALQELKVKVGSQEVYSILVEMSSEGFWLLDKEFKTVYVNSAIEEMLGYPKEEMIGQSWYAFGDPGWVERAKELEKRRVGGIKEPHEFLFVHKDGRKVLARIATTPIYDKDGNFDGALGILSDITRQKEAEDALQIKDMINAIADSSGIGMCILDPDYTIAWYNHVYTQWHGPLEQTRGRNCFEVFEGRDSACPDCPSKLTFETGAVMASERSGLTTSAGNERVIALTTSPIRNANGDVIQVVEIAQDITERKQAEQEKRQFYRNTIKSVTQGKLDLVPFDEIREYLESPELTASITCMADTAAMRHKLKEFCSLKGLGGDRLYLFESAIGEAMTNAVKHAQGSQVYAGVRGNNVWVAVSDEGPGMSASTLPNATLRKGFSTRVSMGLGYTIMMEASDEIKLCTGDRGTTVVLSIDTTAALDRLSLTDFQDIWDEIPSSSR